MAINIGSFDFGKVIEFMQASGFYDYLLPLLLIFAIVFAVLQKTMILGSEGEGENKVPKSNINVLVSLIIGLLVVVQPGIVATINGFVPKVSLLMVVILAILMIIALLAGGTHKGIAGTAMGLATIVVFIGIILALTSSIPGSTGIMSSEDAQSLLTWLIPLGILGIAIYLLTRKPANEQDRYSLSKLAKNLRGEED